MPFKRKGRPYWFVQLFNVRGFGNTSQFNTKTSDKRRAQQMEGALREVVERSYTDDTWLDVLHAMHRDPVTKAEPKLSIIDVARHFKSRTLHQMKQSISDPLVWEAIEGFRKRAKDEQVLYGLNKLETYLEEHVRNRDTKLTILRSGQFITRMCMDLEASGYKRNYIRRGVLNATSKLLSFHWGRSVRDQIFADVNFSKEHDGREVRLSPAEIVSLMDVCNRIAEENKLVRPYVSFLPAAVAHALLTSADRGVVIGTRARDFSVIYDQVTGRYSGSVFLDDRKTKYRQRTIPVADYLGAMVAPLLKEKEAGQLVYDIKQEQLRYWWDKARDAAGLGHVRFKDLRHQASIYANEAGMSYAKVKILIGHASRDVTARYLAHQCVIDQSEIEAMAEKMGLVRRRKLRRAAQP